MTVPKDRFTGALVGLALGDAFGAPHEGGVLERLLWRLIGRTRDGHRRWTDDTQMSLDLAESLAARGELDLDDVARRFAAGYRWSRGYGAGASRLLRRIRRGMPWREAARSVYRDGSFGNGGAMRSPVIGLFCAGAPRDRLVDLATAAAGVTHAHPLGIDGAVAIAAAVAGAATGSTDAKAPTEILHQAQAHTTRPEFTDRFRLAAEYLNDTATPTPGAVARTLGNGIAAPESCVTAIYVALRFLPQEFRSMLEFIAACGGDVDTIGAMSGAIWGAAHGLGDLPRDAIAELEQSERIVQVAEALHAAAARNPT